MIPQNPFQGARVDPVASPVSLGLSPGRAAPSLQQDLVDLAPLSQTAAAALEFAARASKEKFKEDFSIGQAAALSHPQLLSDLQVGVEAQKGGDEATKRLRASLKRLRKEGKITGPETPGFYAGVETSLGIRVGKNKGDALNQFIQKKVGSLDPESDTSPTPATFDQLQAEFEAQYKDPTDLPVGYYAADGFANAYGQDIESARNGYFKVVAEYEKRRGLDNTLQLGADVIVADTLDGVKTPEMIGQQIMNHMDNAVDLGLVPAEQRREVLHGIIALAAQRASVSRGDRQAQLGLDVIEAAKEWKIAATGKTLIEDDPAFFEKQQDDWERRLENDTVQEGQLRQKQSQSHIIEWTQKLNTNIAQANAKGMSVSQAIEDTRTEAQLALKDSAYFGDVDLALVNAGAAARSSYDRTDPEVARGWQKEIALNPGSAVDILAQGPVPGLSEETRVEMIASAVQSSSIGSVAGKEGFSASLNQIISAPAKFIPEDATAFGSVQSDLDDLLIDANSKHAMVQRKLAGGVLTYEDAQAEIARIKQEAADRSKAIIAPIRAEYTKYTDAYLTAEAAGDLGSGMNALNRLKELGYINVAQYSSMSNRIREQASFNPMLRTSEWAGFRSMIDDVVTGGDKTNLLKVAAANERIGQEEADLKKQALAWRNEGYTQDDINTILLQPYLSERRKALLTESPSLGYDAEGLEQELKGGGTIQSYIQKTDEAAAYQQVSNSVILEPLKQGLKVNLDEAQKKLFSPSFTGGELNGILNNVYNGGSFLTPSTVARTMGLRDAAALAADIAEGVSYPNAKDKDQMMVDLLGLVPGGVHHSFILQGSIPVFSTDAYALQIQLKSAGSYDAGITAMQTLSYFRKAEGVQVPEGPGVPQGTQPLHEAPIASVKLNPYRHSMFSTVDEIRQANENGTLMKLMSALNLPLTTEAAKLFVDAQTNLLTLGYN